MMKTVAVVVLESDIIFLFVDFFVDNGKGIFIFNIVGSSNLAFT